MIPYNESKKNHKLDEFEEEGDEDNDKDTDTA